MSTDKTGKEQEVKTVDLPDDNEDTIQHETVKPKRRITSFHMIIVLITIVVVYQAVRASFSGSVEESAEDNAQRTNTIVPITSESTPSASSRPSPAATQRATPENRETPTIVRRQDLPNPPPQRVPNATPQRDRPVVISQEDYDKMTPTARSRFQALPGNLSEDGGGQQYYIRMPGAEPSTTATRQPTQTQIAPTENTVKALNNIRPLPVTEPAPSNLVNRACLPLF